MQPIQQFGISLIHALQTMSPALDGVMNFFTFLGRIEFYLLLIPFVYWTIDKRWGMRALLTLLVIDSLGMAFKLLFHQPRPYWIGGVKQLGEEASYGIPSTHASDSLAVGGYLASRFSKSWVWILTGFVLLMIGLSRLYLGAHFPHDVLFGWLIGGAVLWGVIKWADPIAAWAKPKSLSSQVIAGFLVSIVIIVIGILLRSLISGTADPAAWSSFAGQARSLTHFFTLAGAFFGAIVGYALMCRLARFQTSGTWTMRAIRYIVGMIGVLVIYLGLAAAFSPLAADESAVGYVLRYVRYAALTLWMTWAAPWVFLKLKLAEAEI